jgi:alkyl sulfatase BDS1-like metallo-beta-lactamase superfamily hydrolase
MRRWVLLPGLAAVLSGPVYAAPMEADPPSAVTRAAQADALARMPSADRRDIDFADRGYLGTRTDSLIRGADGHVAWDLNAYDFIKDKAAPDTVNPSLWRHTQVLNRNGLFKVTDRIYQIRGFDVSNITFIQGDAGWVVIDTLTGVETARAAYDLITEKLGKRPITAIIYTHSHVDHYGGAGALMPFTVPSVPILAPVGFLKAAISENVIAGPAMSRRAAYQFGMPLEKSPTGNVGNGIGLGGGRGTPSLVPPTQEISRTGTEMTLDGVRLRFQVTLGTEAPAEMNIGLPDFKVVDMAENANESQHNILTPRGAVIRNAKAWADDLTEAIDMFAGSEILMTSHAWPRFGRAEVVDYLSKHRDAYAFLHDQTVRLMNKGLNGDEIAAQLKLPAALETEWYDRPYYGSFSFNARAVYQYYMGWYDANPAHLAPLPPEEGGRRYVEAMGGAGHVRSMAQAAYDKGDYAWAAELLNREVFADASDTSARTLLARCYDQMAWQSENSLWRNMYLTGAGELRNGPPQARKTAGVGVMNALPTSDIFDVLAVHLDAEKAGSGKARIAVVFPDRKEQVTVTVANEVLTHRPGSSADHVDATLTINRGDFIASVFGGEPLADKIASGAAQLTGDREALGRIASWLDLDDPAFPIVTPRPHRP